jgi:hypothetical protein
MYILMSTPYAISTSNGSVSYDNYVNAAITGPLSTDRTPNMLPNHNKGILIGIRPTPPQFYPSQTPVNADMNTNARRQYLRTIVNKEALAKQIALGKLSTPIEYYINTSQRMVATSSHTNYITPIPSSMYTTIVKSNAVGQSAYKVNLPYAAPISTKVYMPSSTRSSIRRARSGGCTAPKKKGAIQNTSLANPRICAWGSIVRQNY